MSVKVVIPSVLRRYTKGQEVVEVAACNVMECLDNLMAQFPALKRRLYNEQGKVAGYVHLFINREQASIDGALKDGDELLILLSISGG